MYEQKYGHTIFLCLRLRQNRHLELFCWAIHSPFSDDSMTLSIKKLLNSYIKVML